VTDTITKNESLQTYVYNGTTTAVNVFTWDTIQTPATA
jgi:hypothetical protein